MTNESNADTTVKVKPADKKLTSSVIYQILTDHFNRDTNWSKFQINRVLLPVVKKRIGNRDVVDYEIMRAIAACIINYRLRDAVTNAPNAWTLPTDEGFILSENALLNALSGLDYSSFIRWVIPLLADGDVFRAKVAKFLVTGSSFGMSILQSFFSEVVDNHVSELKLGKAKVKYSKGESVSKIDEILWLSKAPSSESKTSYFFEKFMYYLPGYVVKVNENR